MAEPETYQAARISIDRAAPRKHTRKRATRIRRVRRCQRACSAWCASDCRAYAVLVMGMASILKPCYGQFSCKKVRRVTYQSEM